MKTTRNHSKGQGRAKDHGGDSETLIDRIFLATGVQAKVFLKDGEVTLTTIDYADFIVAKSWLHDKGFNRVIRK
jgi:hypothetical protein